MSTTVRRVMERTLRNLSQVPGASVQLYSEDTIIEYIRISFDMYFDAYEWPGYNEWVDGTLDGTLGVITRDLSQLTGTYERRLLRYEDIISIYIKGSHVQLTEMPPGVSPLDEDSSSQAMYYKQYFNATKIFRIIPYTATGELNINYKPYVADFNIDTELFLDETLLVLAASYQYLSKDGTNDANTNEVQAQLATREGQLANMRAKPIPLSPSRRIASSNRWWA